MKARPPIVVESLLALLIPPACREHVLGDLHERFTGLGSYIVEAVRTVPFVIISQIRRAVDIRVFLMEASALYFSFMSAAWRAEGVAFLHQERSLLRLVIPAGAALFVLLTRDAYSTRGPRISALGSVLETTVGVGFAFLFEVVLSAASGRLALPRLVVLVGSATSVVLVSAVRIFFARNADRPRGAT